MHTLGTMAVLSVALGACANPFGTPGGTIEYPGSGAGPNAVAVYVVNDKDTVASISKRYGVPKLTYVVGQPSDTLAKMRVQKANPAIDVAWLAGSATHRRLTSPPAGSSRSGWAAHHARCPGQCNHPD